MAIIICPECNEKISSSVNQCVHCGAKITYCPECESVFAQTLQKCPSCGFELEKIPQTIAEEQNKEPKIEVESSIVANKKWLLGSPVRSMFFGNSWLAWIPRIVYVVIFAIVLINIGSALKGDTSLNGVAVLCVSLLFVEDAFEEVIATVKYISYSSWFKANNLSLRALLDKDFNLEFGKMVVDTAADNGEAIKFSLNAELYKNDANFKICLLLRSIFKCILKCVRNVFVAIFAVIFVDLYSVYVYLSGGQMGIWEFITNHMTGWGYLIAAAVLVICSYVCGYIFNKKEEDLRLNWINTNAPDKKGIYEKYISDPEMFALIQAGDDATRNV